MDILDIIGAGLNIGAGFLAADAAKDAAKYQRKAAMDGAENFRPYAQLGDYAAGELQGRLNNNALLGDFSMRDFRADPGYRFRRAEGQKAIDRAAGARGKRYSGQTLKGMARFNQALASDEYQRAYNRDANNRTMQYNFLAGPVGMGQGAAGTIGQYMGNAGDARAAGRVGSSNALLGGLGDAFDQFAVSRYMQQPQIYLVPA